MYLDNAATTKVSKPAIDAMIECFDSVYGNPSSIHAMGFQAEKKLKQARQIISTFIRCEPKQVVFTSGATESSNSYLHSVLSNAKGNKRHVITTQIEHPSVLEIFKHYEQRGFDVTYLPVNLDGIITLEALKMALREDTILVSIMAVNNEIGSIQPIEDLCAFTKGYCPQILFHTDAVQALGKIEVNLQKWGVDAASFSAHKIYGPKGVGALYIQNPAQFKPFFLGGGQENGLRSGTENLPGIIGFSVALETYFQKCDFHKAATSSLKNLLLNRVTADFDDVLILSPKDQYHVDHIVSLAFKGVKSEVLVHALEMENIFVSSGSACASHKKESVSHVIQGMGVPKQYAEGVIRISFSTDQSEEALDVCLNKIYSSVTSQRDLLIRRHK